MQVHWGALPLILCAAALTIGLGWMARCEMRTGTALRFFVPYAPWSRDRNPRLFAVRQIINWLMVAIAGAGTLSLVILMCGILDA